MYTTLIEISELRELLQRVHLRSDPIGAHVSLIDCRFDLPRPDWGAAAYAAGHIPGAVYAHLDHDLSGPVTPQSGRHPLPSREAFAAWLGQAHARLSADETLIQLESTLLVSVGSNPQAPRQHAQ